MKDYEQFCEDNDLDTSVTTSEVKYHYYCVGFSESMDIVIEDLVGVLDED